MENGTHNYYVSMERAERVEGGARGERSDGMFVVSTGAVTDTWCADRWAPTDIQAQFQSFGAQRSFKIYLSKR